MKTIYYIFFLIIIFLSCDFQDEKTRSHDKEKTLNQSPKDSYDDRFYKLIKEGRVCLNNMELDKATEIFLVVIKLYPDTVSGYYGLGVVKALECHQSGRECYEAIEFMEKTLLIEPNYRKANFNIGTCYIKLENYSEAIKFLSKAIQNDKTNGELYMNRGYAKLKANLKPEACEDFKLAIKHGYDDANKYIVTSCN